MLTRDRILAARRSWLQARRNEGVEGVYKAQAIALPLPPSLPDALLVPRAERALIPILHRTSTDGREYPAFDVGERVSLLTELGASAIGVCVDEELHGGSYQDILSAAQSTQLPIICLDYILDTVQITMARAHGAAAVVICAELLNDERLLRGLVRHAIDLRLEVIVDGCAARHMDLVERLCIGHSDTSVIRVVGVNLTRLETALGEPRVYDRVAPKLPEHTVGIGRYPGDHGRTIAELEEMGLEALLVDGSCGETELRATFAEFGGEIVGGTEPA